MRLPGLDTQLPLSLAGTVRPVAEGALALAAGLMVAKLVWLLAAPAGDSGLSERFGQAGPALSVAGPYAILETSNPFAGGAMTQAALAAAPTQLNIQLTGLRSAAENEQGGTAVIILPDGQQRRFEAGDTILPGAVLEAVMPDRVLLRVNGQLEELVRNPGAMRSISGASAPAAPEPARAVQAEAVRVTPGELMTDVVLQPEMRSGAVSGYRLSPRGMGHFEAAGLVAGDLVLRINGQSIEGMRPDMIQGALGSSNEVALDVVREGRIIRLRLTAESGLSQ